MSELKDVTSALRAIHNETILVQDCLLILVRDSQQQAEWRHAQKNRAMVEDLERDQREGAILQIQTWCGDFSRKLGELVERLDGQAQTRRDDVRALSGRLGQLEARLPDEETTKP
jgi:hypothetical protein